MFGAPEGHGTGVLVGEGGVKTEEQFGVLVPFCSESGGRRFPNDSINTQRVGLYVSMLTFEKQGIQPREDLFPKQSLR